ncbi:nuclear transport factor 2 family protein [Paraburkholderia sediminicola]|uniref:YybH family protein n=1 Tax=Paraburkholderia sediminicola TaxID=458836 RepID=UPI0038BC2001
MTEQDILDHLLSRYDVWMTAVAEKDIDAIASIYASDAVYMPPGQPRHVGKEAVVAVWRTYFTRPDFNALYTPSLTVSASLDIAYDVGSYVVSLTRDGEPVDIHGKYVVIWKKEKSDWVVAVDIDNTDHPVQPSAAPEVSGVDVISQAPNESVSPTKISAHFDETPRSIVAPHSNE